MDEFHLIYMLLKRRRTKDAIEIIKDNPWLLDKCDRDKDTLAHLAVRTDNGEMLAFLVNFITEITLPQDRRKRLIHVFEAKNKNWETPVDLAIRLEEYNFMVFLVQYCCPSGASIFTDTSVRQAVYVFSTKYLEFIFTHALTRIQSPENMLYNMYNFFIRRYLLVVNKQYQEYGTILAEGSYDEVVALLQRIPCLAWHDIQQCENAAVIFTKRKDIQLLNFLQQFIRQQQCPPEVVNRLLIDSFEKGSTQLHPKIHSNPLVCAIQQQDLATFQFLVEHCSYDGVAIFSPPYLGHRPLWREAVQLGSIEILEYILLNTPNLDKIFRRNRYGLNCHTISDLACIAGRDDVRKYIEAVTLRQLQWRREHYLVRNARDALYTNGNSLPELILGVLEQELEVRAIRDRCIT